MPPSLTYLESLAKIALASPSSEERAAATVELRFLSAFDQWDYIKSLFLETSDVNLLFVVAKAILFVVCNEIGPQERSEIQVFVLQYVQVHGKSLPKYLVHTIFSIYAAALYLNWRLMVISEDSGSDDPSGSSDSGSSSLGMQLEQTMGQYLDTHQMIACMQEVLNHFAKEDSRSSLTSVRASFSKTVLPHFMRFAEQQCSEVGRAALELVCQVLECVPQGNNAPIITVMLTTDESIYVQPGASWLPAIRRVVSNCCAYIHQHVDVEADEDAKLCLRVLRMATCVMISDWSGRQSLREDIDAFSSELLETGTQLIRLFRVTHSPTLMQNAIAMVVNCLERDEVLCGNFIFQRPELVEEWRDIALSSCERWVEEEQEGRQSLLHLFYLIGARGVPLPSSMDTATGDDLRRARIEGMIRQVFEAYFRNVMSKAHLSEESHDIRCAEAMVLHSEEHLQPLSEMMFCERLGLTELIAVEMQKYVEYYGACLDLRRGQSVPEETMLALMVMCTDFVDAMGADDITLFLTHIVLSKIAVIVATVAMGIRCTSMFPSDPIVDLVGKFLHDLIAPDDDVTDTLLQCLTLTDDDDKGANGLQRNKKKPIRTEKKLHLGVLRSLFLFASSVAESDFGRHKVVEEGLELICYVVQKHSMCLALVSDACLLLQLFLTNRVNSSTFLNSERMLLMIESTIANKVPLLSSTVPPQTTSARQTREELLRLISSFLEARSQTSLQSHLLLERLVEGCASPMLKIDVSTCLRDVAELATGCSSASSLLVVLTWIADYAVPLTTVLQNNMTPMVRSDVFHLFATLSELSCNFLREDNISPTQWEVASLMFNNTQQFLEYLQVPRIGESGMYFPPNSILETEMYDLCTFIGDACGGSWCNMGVMMHYGDRSVVATLLLSVEVLLTIPPSILISHESRRHRVFNAISQCLLFNYPSAELQWSVSVRNIWPRLLSYLVSCVEYRFSHLALKCIQQLILKLWPTLNVSPAIPQNILESIVREVAVAISTTTLAEETFALGFNVMQLCFERYPEPCEGVLEHLLSYCSAYHRVRIRCILMMMRGGQSSWNEATKNFLNVFGTQSKLATLSAW